MIGNIGEKNNVLWVNELRKTLSLLGGQMTSAELCDCQKFFSKNTRSGNAHLPEKIKQKLLSSVSILPYRLTHATDIESGNKIWIFTNIHDNVTGDKFHYFPESTPVEYHIPPDSPIVASGEFSLFYMWDAPWKSRSCYARYKCIISELLAGDYDLVELAEEYDDAINGLFITALKKHEAWM